MAIVRIKKSQREVIDVRQFSGYKTEKINSVHHVLEEGIHLVWKRWSDDTLGGLRVQGLGVNVQGLYIKLNGQQ